jgi:hypothetical protein
MLVIAPAGTIAQDEGPGAGVDIVFVVDQSGSMIRGPILDEDSNLRGPPSDPDNLAIRTVKDGMGVIISHIYQLQLERDSHDMVEKTHRFGLVLFGGTGDPNDASNARIVVDLTPIQVYQETDGSLKSNIDGLIPAGGTNLGETAFSHAIDAACGVLNCTTPTPEGRERVVVLLTDGQPAFDRFPYNWADPEPYFSSLQQRYADFFGADRTEFWVIGLDKNDTFWSRNGRFWERIATPERTSRLIDASQISSKFREIAMEAIGEPLGDPKPCNATFMVDPYLVSLNLSLQYPDTESKAEFSLPDGSVLKAGNAGVAHTPGVQSETFVVTNPPPGTWSCQVIGGVDATFRDLQGAFEFTRVEVEPRVKVERSEGPVAPSTCYDFDLSVLYLDNNEKPIVEEPGYPLKSRAVLTIDGDPQSRNLLPDPDRPNHWTTEQPFTPGPQGGNYPLSIYVDYVDSESERTAVFTDTEQVVTIDPALPCIHMLEPEDGSTSLMYHRLSPRDLEVAVILKQGGEPGMPTGVFQEDLSQIVTGTLQGPDDLHMVVHLRPDDEQPGRFVTKVESEKIPDKGEYTFSAELHATTTDAKGNLPYYVSTSEVTFERDLGLWKKWFEIGLRIAVFLGILIVVVLAGFFIFLITGSHPRGSLILEEKATGEVARNRTWDELRTISLNKMKLLGLFHTRWPSQKLRMAGLRKIKVRRLEGRGRDGVKVILTRDQRARKSGSKAREELNFTRDGEKKTFDGGKFRMTYENYSSKR